jgi:predicted acylesterase/phospholipase RssA
MSISKRMPPSLAFSGAGFLTSYHLGVVDCLERQGLLDHVIDPPQLNDSRPRMILSGVSGGALAAASIALRIRSDDAMAISMRIAANARTGGIFDALHPSISLVDRVADELQALAKDVDEEDVLWRISGGNLFIGLTDSAFFPLFRRQNEFESIAEILAACTLSSYVPGLTGPAPLERSIQSHPAVTHATKVVKNMVKRGAAKDVKGNRKQLLLTDSSELWDGGLAKLFPTINSKSILVTPFAGTFRNPTVSPKKTDLTPMNGFPIPKLSAAISQYASMDLSLENVRTIRYISLSSTDEELQSWFALGYDSCLHFLNENGMIEKFSLATTTPGAKAVTKEVTNAASAAPSQ